MGSKTITWCDACGKETEELTACSFVLRSEVVREAGSSRPTNVDWKSLCDDCVRTFRRKWLDKVSHHSFPNTRIERVKIREQ